MESSPPPIVNQQASIDSTERLEAILREFYSRLNPEKVSQAKKLAHTMYGRQQELDSKLKFRYGVGIEWATSLVVDDTTHAPDVNFFSDPNKFKRGADGSLIFDHLPDPAELEAQRRQEHSAMGVIWLEDVDALNARRQKAVADGRFNRSQRNSPDSSRPTPSPAASLAAVQPQQRHPRYVRSQRRPSTVGTRELSETDDELFAFGIAQSLQSHESQEERRADDRSTRRGVPRQAQRAQEVSAPVPPPVELGPDPNPAPAQMPPPSPAVEPERAMNFEDDLQQRGISDAVSAIERNGSRPPPPHSSTHEDPFQPDDLSYENLLRLDYTRDRRGDGLSLDQIRKKTRAVRLPPDTILECSICLEGWTQDQRTAILLPRCKHVFHGACIGTWFKENRACPNCRVPVIGAI